MLHRRNKKLTFKNNKFHLNHAYQKINDKFIDNGEHLKNCYGNIQSARI